MAGEVVVLLWTGPIDVGTTGEFEQDINTAVRGGPSELILDVSAVTFTDSSALGLLVHARNRCAEDGVSLSVRGASEALRTVLSMTGLDQVLHLTRE